MLSDLSNENKEGYKARWMFCISSALINQRCYFFKHPSLTRTCPTYHKFKNDNRHKGVCSGIPCPGIEDCPTEYLKGKNVRALDQKSISQKNNSDHPEVRQRFNERIGLWSKRAREWAKDRNIEKLEAKKAQENLGAHLKAKISEKKLAIMAKTHFSPPSIVEQQAALSGEFLNSPRQAVEI
jgi:hypothetical protein